MTTGIINIAILVGFVFMLLAFLLAIVRLVKGPSIYDRIAAMDLMASITMGFILIYSLILRKSFYIDIAIVISLISFIGTVAISIYLRQKNKTNV